MTLLERMACGVSARIRSAVTGLGATGLAVASVTAAGVALAGPAEAPPEGFAGDRFVDSRGCLFQRAEVGGQRVWAAVLDADRRQLCNGTETLAALDAGIEPAAAVAEAEPAAEAPEPEAARDAARADLSAAPADDPAPASTAAQPAQPPAEAAMERATTTNPRPDAFVQIAAYGSRNRAVAVAELAREAGFAAAAHGGRGGLHLVRLGPFRDDRQARYALSWARAAGFPDAFRVP